MSDKYQLVAFPLPQHIVEFFCSKIKTPTCILDNGSITTKLPIGRRTFFGELIHDGLIESRRLKLEPSNFYLVISNGSHSKRRSKINPDPRIKSVKLPKARRILIEKLLREMMENELVSYVDGVTYAHQKIKGYKKGITNKSIAEFMFHNQIGFTETSFETIKKIYYRGRNRRKALKILRV